jgi:hypothetical protein
MMISLSFFERPWVWLAAVDEERMRLRASVRRSGTVAANRPK